MTTVPADKIPKRDGRGRTVWVTRERPKIDRIACPWLIRRFVDPAAVFLYVASPEVEPVAERFNAVPFDIENVFWSHRSELCTFDVMVTEFGLSTPALERLATMVRAAASPLATKISTITPHQINPPDRWRPEAALQHPTSPGQHQRPLPQPGLPPLQNQTGLRYTLSASGRSFDQGKVVVAKQLSLIRAPMRLNTVRNAGQGLCWRASKYRAGSAG
jgi:hypothetical protein